MPIQKPDIQEIYSYILLTHKADHITLTMPQIQATLKKEPSAQFLYEKAVIEGHFKAINQTMILADSVDFPAKSPLILTNEYASNTALYWLRELHINMMYPIAQFGVNNATGQLHIQPSQVGTYRCTPRALAFSMAPAPEVIPKLLHLWLKDITEFDTEIKDKVNNPFGLSQTQVSRMLKITKEASMFLSCLQPFEDGNNRVAKLVENILRLRWHMPWRTIYELEEELYLRDFMDYQSTGILKWTSRL